MNETLLTVLNETLHELTDRHRIAEADVTRWQEAVQRARDCAQRIEEQEACAIHEDEQVIQKMDALRGHLNSLQDKPQALIAKLDSLVQEQHGTAGKRSRATQAANDARRALQQEETRLAVAEKRRKEAQRHITEVSEQIAHARRAV